MADYPPFMNAYGSIPKILTKITEAKAPDRFSQEFLATALGFNGGSYKPFIPLLKRIGFLNSDGTPTDLYRRFRNPEQRGMAMAEGIRRGFSHVYARNEYADKLDKSKFQGLITEMTGLEPNHATVRAIVETFFLLKQFADFDSKQNRPSPEYQPQPSEVPNLAPIALNGGTSGGIKFAYTIYLNLPNTDNIAVFNAIFKSLRENLLLS